MEICKHEDCKNYALTEPNKSLPSILTTYENEGFIISFPTKNSAHGYCYYHRKKSLGLFGEEKKIKGIFDELRRLKSEGKNNKSYFTPKEQH